MNLRADQATWSPSKRPPNPAKMIDHFITGLSARKSLKNRAISLYCVKVSFAGGLNPPVGSLGDMLRHLNAYQPGSDHYFFLELVAEDIAAFQIFLGSALEKLQVAIDLVGVKQGCKAAVWK